MKSNRTFALDLGTTKFCFAALKKQNASATPLIETISVKAEGMRRGMLADFQEARTALLKLIEITEKEFNTHISKVTVGIAGSHLNSSIICKDIHPTHGIITDSTIDKIYSIAKNEQSPLNKVILQTVPLLYKLDDREWVASPKNFHAEIVTGKFFRIGADKNYVKDVMDLCNQCGLEVVNFYAEPYASASVTLSEHDKKFGVAVIDIGGGTTDGIIFYQGIPIKIFTINIGGILMTHDLSIGLGISYEAAEHIKLKFGLRPPVKGEFIQIKNIHSKQISVAVHDIYRILFARIYELTLLIQKEIRAVKIPLKSGLVVTGGGSEVHNITDVMSKILNLHAKKSLPHLALSPIPENPNSNKDEQTNLAGNFSTACGMVFLETQLKKQESLKGKAWFLGKHFNTFINWVKELS